MQGQAQSNSARPGWAPLGRAAAGALSLLLAAPALSQPRPADDDPIPSVPGADIFGFTSPTDVGDPGDRGLAFETTTRIGKGSGLYVAPTLKTQLSATVAENLSLAVSPFLSGTRIRSVPGIEDRRGVEFDGVSFEATWRVLPRTRERPYAATLSVEPRWARVDALTGGRVSAHGAELKLFTDAVLLPDRLFAAINASYAFGVQRTLAVPNALNVPSSGTTLSAALAVQATERLVLGAEVRHLTAFAGAGLNRFSGQAVFAGPNLFVKLSDGATLNLAWTPQAWGRAASGARGGATSRISSAISCA